MPLSPSRFHAVTESSFACEQDALDFVRGRLPDHDRYKAWSNFEFIAADDTSRESQPPGLDQNVATWSGSRA